MRVWLIKISEPLPIDRADERLGRVGILAERLVSAGHEVVWWTSTFDHARKQHYFPEDAAFKVNDSYVIQLLYSKGYDRNVSLNRILDHRQISRKFARMAQDAPRPDVILSSVPVPGLALQAVNYGRENNVPVILDMRDMWPEALIRLAPSWARGLAEIALWPMRRTVQSACSKATGICGITSAFMDWGLKQARREKGRWDRDFPLGYTNKAPDEEAIEEARSFWAQHGLTGEAEEFVACFFGRLGHQFEIETVIEAAKIVQDDERPFRMVLCGTGDNFQRYKELAEGLDNVLFPGWINSTQIWAMLRMSSVGLAPYPSHMDFQASIPNKAIEYLSAGLPIVSSLQGILAGILGDNNCGLTYDNGSAEQLAAALRQLRDDPKRRTAMSDNARRVFEERFVAEKVYAEMVEYLEEVSASWAAKAK